MVAVPALVPSLPPNCPSEGSPFGQASTVLRLRLPSKNPWPLRRSPNTQVIVVCADRCLQAACSSRPRDLPRGERFRVSASQRVVPMRKFGPRQQVWIAGRGATFLYHAGEEAAVVRYRGEREGRVVPVRKIAASRPEETSNDPAAGRGPSAFAS